MQRDCLDQQPECVCPSPAPRRRVAYPAPLGASLRFPPTTSRVPPANIAQLQTASYHIREPPGEYRGALWGKRHGAVRHHTYRAMPGERARKCPPTVLGEGASPGPAHEAPSGVVVQRPVCDHWRRIRSTPKGLRRHYHRHAPFGVPAKQGHATRTTLARVNLRRSSRVVPAHTPCSSLAIAQLRQACLTGQLWQIALASNLTAPRPKKSSGLSWHGVLTPGIKGDFTGDAYEFARKSASRFSLQR